MNQQRTLSDMFTAADAAEVKRRLADEVQLFCTEVLQPAVDSAVDAVQRSSEPRTLCDVESALQGELERIQLGDSFYAQIALTVNDTVNDICYSEDAP